MLYDVLVIGGGAAGIMAACAAADQGSHVCILEGNDILGKKILSTGNGRCNFTNDTMSEEFFRTDSGREQMTAVLDAYTKEDVLTFFQEIGIVPKIRFGTGYYPLSMQASQVRMALELVVKSKRIHVEYGFLVSKLLKQQSCFRAISKDGTSIDGGCCIVTTGGSAAPKLGSDGVGMVFAKAFGLHIIPPTPALVPLLCKEKYFKRLQGVRTEGKVSVTIGQQVYSDLGELQFTKEGISGIPVFQISRYVSKYLLEHKECTVSMDLFPYRNEVELMSALQKRFYENGWYKTCYEAMIGMLHDKLIQCLFQICGIPEELPATEIKKGQLRKFVTLSKAFTVTVVDTKGFAFAQTTAGGISLQEVDCKLQSKKVPGLYFAGEVLDVDGICGGYNLQWAWSSGNVAGTAAAMER